ncbi:uncharacterized protein LOC123202167 isoform X6 [Mangifera indica]|uniref:uncharacterized protein LOC123202167 isoform X6 n=1 Tax=Mangifera indica TaxID=29780 RepID=UPI001CFAA6F1|nr:uncharacterized protein LOC123202167 isoform X6 [Mangifera indica]
MVVRECNLGIGGLLAPQGIPQKGNGLWKRMRYCGRLFNDSRERTGRKLRNVSGTGQLCSAYTWCVLLSLAKCFRDSKNVQCLRMFVCFSGECFKDWSVRGKSSQSRNWGMQLYLFDKQPWKMKDNIYSFRVCNFVMVVRECNLGIGGLLALQGIPQKGNGLWKRMRYCGRLFNDSRERTGRKLFVCFSAECFRDWTIVQCSHMQNVSGTRKMYSAYACRMFQGPVCTVDTWSIYAWCENESLCVFLSLGEYFKDWSVRYTHGLYTHGVKMKVCVFCYLLPAVLCATKILLFFGLIYNDLERIYRGKSSQSRNWGMQLYLFDKQPWKMKDNIYSFRVCNFCYGGQRMQSWHGRTTGPTGHSTKGQWTLEEVNMMRYCGRLFNDSRERTGRKLRNVSGTGQLCSAYTWCVLLSLAKCFRDSKNVQCLRMVCFAISCGMFQGPVCTVHTWSIYAWCENESLCVLLSLAECFKDRSVLCTHGLYTHGVKMKVCVFCYLLRNVSRTGLYGTHKNVSRTGQMYSAYIGGRKSLIQN